MSNSDKNRKFGFVRVAAAVPSMKVADCEYNVNKIIEMVQDCDRNGVEVVVFPELCITGYTCGDLFQQKTLLNAALEGLKIIKDASKVWDNIVIIVGLPLERNNQIYNVAAVINDGEILGYIPKKNIPNYKEFYEERWFAPGDSNFEDVIFRCKNFPDFTFGVEICEDVWVPNPPSTDMSLAGASIIFNLSASNEIAGKYEYRKDLISGQSGRCIGAYVYTSSSVSESTSDLVFSGHAMIAENGSIMKESERFSFEDQLIISDIDVEKLMNDRRKINTYGQSDKKYTVVEFENFGSDRGELYRTVNPHPFIPKLNSKERLEEIFNIQAYALAKRLKHINMNKVVIGVSGGLDSTLALLVTHKAFKILDYDLSGILGITMPGFGTTDETYENALDLMKALGISMEEISIKDACIQHFKDINHDIKNYNLTYENTQARERTQILMDKGFVIGTGDLSELALGWCTYNGDHMSMYAVNCSIPKTLVKHLVSYAAENEVSSATKQVLRNIVGTTISPELLPPNEHGKIAQKTEDLVGPYELHDFFIYNMIRNGFEPRKILHLAKIAFKDIYDEVTIKKWLITFYKRFFNNQFKRNCIPDGPKVGTISLSPRGDWRMPSDAVANLWIKELEE